MNEPQIIDFYHKQNKPKYLKPININQTDPKNFTGHKDAPKFVETDINEEEKRRKTIIRHFKKKK